MIESGLRAVFIGGETAHDVINDKVMNKGVKRKDILETIQCIKFAAATVGVSCQVGLALIYPCPVLPEVNLETIFEENLRLVAEAMPDSVIVNPPGIFPGTVWFEQAASFGFRIDEKFTGQLMQYEYSIYKPAEFWPKINYSLNGQDLPSLLRQTGRMSKAIENLEIPIGVSDELLMMLEAIGRHSKAELFEFKKHSLIDIMSGNSKYLSAIVTEMNSYSKLLARSNQQNTGKQD
jgi:hypothetical protein